MKLKDIIEPHNLWYLEKEQYEYLPEKQFSSSVKPGDYLCLIHKLHHNFIKAKRVLKYNTEIVLLGFSYANSETFFLKDYYFFHKRVVRGNMKDSFETLKVLQNLQDEQNKSNSVSTQNEQNQNILEDTDIDTSNNSNINVFDLEYNEFGELKQ